MLGWIKKFRTSQPEGIGKTLINKYIIQAKPEDGNSIEGAKAEIRKFKELLKEYPVRYHGNTTKWDIIVVIDYLLDNLEFYQRLAEIWKSKAQDYEREAQKGQSNILQTNVELVEMLKNLREDYQQAKSQGISTDGTIKISEGLLNWTISTLEGLYTERKRRETIIEVCLTMASNVIMPDVDGNQTLADKIKKHLEKKNIYL
jgi:hypothetical protein